MIVRLQLVVYLSGEIVFSIVIYETFLFFPKDAIEKHKSALKSELARHKIKAKVTKNKDLLSDAVKNGGNYDLLNLSRCLWYRPDSVLCTHTAV